MQISSFQDLRTWREGHELTLEIYRVTNSFPTEERYGLTSQIRRAAVSVPSNIAEGMGRYGTKDFVRFLINSRGSLQEVLYQLLLARDLGYINQDNYENITKRYNGLCVGINVHIDRLESRSS